MWLLSICLQRTVTIFSATMKNADNNNTQACDSVRHCLSHDCVFSSPCSEHINWQTRRRACAKVAATTQGMYFHSSYLIHFWLSTPRDGEERRFVQALVYGIGSKSFVIRTPWEPGLSFYTLLVTQAVTLQTLTSHWREMIMFWLCVATRTWACLCVSICPSVCWRLLGRGMVVSLPFYIPPSHLSCFLFPPFRF